MQCVAASVLVWRRVEDLSAGRELVERPSWGNGEGGWWAGECQLWLKVRIDTIVTYNCESDWRNVLQPNQSRHSWDRGGIEFDRRLRVEGR